MSKRARLGDWSSHHPLLSRMHIAIKAEIDTVVGCEPAQIERRFCRSDGGADCGSIVAWD